jgi:hypothetical protein
MYVLEYQTFFFFQNSNFFRTPWTELKPTSPIIPGKVNPTNDEIIKHEREAKDLFTKTRTQDVLSKWTQTQFKDNLKDIDGRKIKFVIYLNIFFVFLSTNSCSIIKRY